MLYDPKWEKADKTHAGVSLCGLIAWLETMPPHERYDFMNPYKCVLAQYQIAQGIPENDPAVAVPVSSDGWLTDIVQSTGKHKDWTFGAALQRARAALSQDERR